MIQHSPRLRKSLSSMTINDPDRVRYFICIKMLGILPPLSPQFEQWAYSCHQDNSRINPSSLHEVLIASHSTSCQHFTMHFAYYHKHLMILFEIFLNYSHEVLIGMIERSKKGKNVMQSLAERYGKQKYGHLYKNNREQLDKYWKDLIQFYELNEQKLPEETRGKQIAAHYWNPTNYKDLEDILIPFQLRLPKKEVSPLKYQQYRIDQQTGNIILIEPIGYGNKGSQVIDSLYFQVKGSYPWGVEYSGWKPSVQIYKDIGFQYLNKANQRDQSIYDMLEGKSSSFRGQSKKTYSGLKQWVAKYKQYLQKQTHLIRSRILNYHREETQTSKDVFNVATITEAENILNYGAQVQYKGKDYKFHYISKKEAKDIPGISLNYGLIKQYNLEMPHYTFARAFFYSQNLYSFTMPQEYYLQISHNLFHDKLGYIMNDGSFSLVNLAFFPYHSWIDLSIQMKIRQNRYLQIGGLVGNLNFSEQMSRAQQRKTQYKSFSQNLNNKNSSFNVYTGDNKRSYPELKQNQKHLFFIGNYPIVEYYSQQDNTISIAFAQRDLAISEVENQGIKQLTIRTSLQLDQIYDYYRNFHNGKGRFQKYKGFKDFIFDYNFELCYTNTNGKAITQLLSTNGWNIPGYLEEFREQFKDSPLAVRLDQLQKKKHTIDKVMQNNQSQVFQDKDQACADSQEQIQDCNKINSCLLLIFVKYKANIKNRRQGLWFQFPKLKDILMKEEPYLFERPQYLVIIEQIADNGLFISSIDVFGKQDRAFQCIKCLQYKHIFLDLDQSFRESSPIIWKAIHLSSLNQIVYSSKQNIQAKSMLNQIRPMQIAQFQEFRLATGAEQVEIHIWSNLQSLKTAKTTFLIRIDALSYSSIDQSLHTVISKKITKRIRPQQQHSDSPVLISTFDFYKLHDVTPNNKCDIFDKYVYRTVKAQIVIETSSKAFFNKHIQFNIPNYQRILRLDLRIEEEEEIAIIVQDMDYQKKKCFFSKL